MVPLHPVSLGVAVVWVCTVALAFLCRDLSASVGTLPRPWVNVGMIFGLLNVAIVIAGVWYLPSRLPRIVLRLLQLVRMVAAF